MSFGSFEVLASHRREVAVPRLHHTGLIKNFEHATLDMLRNASYEDILELGLRDMVENGTALLLPGTEQYGLFFYLKNAVNSAYDLLLNCFPKGSNCLVHSLDELPYDARTLMFDAINAAISANICAAAEQQDPLKKLYVIQHIGPGEADHHQPYATTYPQMHWHVYGIPESMQSTGYLSHELQRQPSFKHVLWDPTILISFDILKGVYPHVGLDKTTSSIILKQTDLNPTIDRDDQQLLSEIMSFWKMSWQEIASCMTNFELDNYNRYLPLDQEERVRNVSKYLQKHREITPASQALLLQIAQNARPARSANEPTWNLTHKGIFGSLGYTHDFTEQKSTLRVAPRTFVASNQIGATDGQFHTIKDRQSELNAEARAHIVDVQRKLLGIIEGLLISS